jgi:hypothetical protein
LLAHGWWFSPDTPASSTTKTGRHDIAEILLKVALSTKINQSINRNQVDFITCGCESSAPFLEFTKPGANPRRIGDRLV